MSFFALGVGVVRADTLSRFEGVPLIDVVVRLLLIRSPGSRDAERFKDSDVGEPSGETKTDESTRAFVAFASKAIVSIIAFGGVEGEGSFALMILEETDEFIVRIT